MEGEANVTAEIFKVAVRTPPFWPEEPELWFAQVEGQFANAGITQDSTKFNHVIGELDRHYATEVRDIMLNPPAENKYEKLKTELVKRLSASKDKKLKQLLMHEELGARTPSQFLRHLQSLAGSNVPEEFLKSIWIGRLPLGIQTVLAGRPKEESLESLMDLADRVHDLATAAPGVSAVGRDCANPSCSGLRREVDELREEFRRLGFKREGRSKSRRRSRSGSRRGSSSARSHSSYRRFPICWYHFKYGDRADRCIKPCDYNSSGNATGGQ